MFLRALLVTYLAVNPLPNPEGPIFSQPSTMGRLAYFEAFPANGRGTFGACSTTPPTGARGEVLTFTRASNGTCTKGTDGLRSTGIADGDLQVLSNNQPRVMLDVNGRPKLLVENATTGNQISIRTAELCNAAFADVGTPGCLSDQATGPFGTTTMDSITDNAAGAFEGRSQTIATTSATQFTAFCHVKWSSGAAASASITIAGTGSATGDCTGTKSSLSTTTSDIVECTSPAAYAGTLTAVTYTIRVGTVVGDQGTLLVEGCDIKPASPYRTSHMPAAGAAIARAVETASFAPTWPNSASISMGATFQGPTPVSGGSATALEFNGLPSLLNESGGTWRWFNGAGGLAVALSSSLAGVRIYGWHSGTNRGMAWGSNTNSGADVNAANKFAATLYVGGSAGNRPDGLLGEIGVDPVDTRVR